MPTRFSQLFLRTLRQDPVDAEVASHRLLVRAGYIRRQAPGIFAWLPLGLRVRARLERVIREEMAAAGAQEVLFPALLPREPYEATNRWTEYGDGIFRLKDRKDADYLLAPTHEEVFTLLVKDLYASYRDLPVTLYQIQDKYRDEARPRAGLLRGREFSMKDAYSFDLDDEGLAASYQAQRDAYERVFTRLGLDYVIVQADAGAMGGSRSEEFLHPTPIGEDTFVRSPGGYAANVEAVTTLVPPAQPVDGLPAPVRVDTPDAATIADLVAVLQSAAPREGAAWSAADTLKTVLLAVTPVGGARELVAVGLPGDRELDEKRLEVAFGGAEVEPATAKDLAGRSALVPGYLGAYAPEGAVLGARSASGVRYLVDPRVVDGTVWVTGGNRAGTHFTGVVAGRDFAPDGVVDAAELRDGDPAPDGSGPLETARGMEIGHVFQLGRKYAEALGLQVQGEDGRLTTVTMGSYGIGVTRVLAAIAEANHDERGLVWPEVMAPFDVQVIVAGKDPAAAALAEELAAGFEAAGAEVLLDDRLRESPGVKFADAELIGVPRIVIAGRDSAEGRVELWDRRSGERRTVPAAEALAELGFA